MKVALSPKNNKGKMKRSIFALIFFASGNHHHHHVAAYQNAILSPRSSCRPISSPPSVTTTTSPFHDIVSPISSISVIHRKRHRRRHNLSNIHLSAAGGDDNIEGESSENDEKIPMAFGGDASPSKSFGTTPSSSDRVPNSDDVTYVNGDPSAVVISSSGGAVAVSQNNDDEILATDQLALALVTFAMALSFAGIVSVSGAGAWRYYVAGGICASVSHAITTPIDVVKTRQQVDPELAGRGIVKSTLKIVKRDGLNTLLAGLGPTTFGYLAEGSIKFGIYEVLKPAVSRFLSWSAAVTTFAPLDSRILSLILCGAISGVAASLMLCPMETLRIRLVAEPDFAPGGWVDGGLRMLKEEGVAGLWNGMTSMMCKQVPYTITKNVSFDYITSVAYTSLKTWGYALTSQTKFYVPLCAAMLTSVFSCVSSQPGDMLLSVVNAHEKKQRTREFAKEILERDGFRGFFVGMKARFLHVGIIVTIQLLIYDFVKRLCGIAATGVSGH